MAGIYFREFGLSKIFTRINFREFNLSKIFARIYFRKTDLDIKQKISKENKKTGVFFNVIDTGLEIFQGGLEIPCKVTVSMAGSIKGHMLLQRYQNIVDELYCQPKE